MTEKIPNQYTHLYYPDARFIRQSVTDRKPITLEELHRRRGLPVPEVHAPEVLHVEQHTLKQARENKWGKSTFQMIKPSTRPSGASAGPLPFGSKAVPKR